jgi:hypothetical protein
MEDGAVARKILFRPLEAEQLRSRQLRGHSLAPFIALAPEFTLPGAIELACSAHTWSPTSEAAKLINSWSTHSIVLSHAILAFAGGNLPKVERWAAPRFELRQIASADDWFSEEAVLFQSRFARSLTASGFTRKLAVALSGCFREMVDNVLQHSSPIEGIPAPALAGYHVESGWLTFVVADLGRGVLASLHDNPAWQHLTDSAAALSFALRKGASRRRDMQERDGGLQGMHQALMNHNALIRFRSGDGKLEMDGRSGRHDFVSGKSASLIGTQLTVVCAPSGACEQRAASDEALTTFENLP